MEISTNQTKYQLMMADENTRKVIRDFLEKVASGDVSGLDKSCGLCWALECEFRRKYMDDLVIGSLAYAFILNHSRVYADFRNMDVGGETFTGAGLEFRMNWCANLLNALALDEALWFKDLDARVNPGN